MAAEREAFGVNKAAAGEHRDGGGTGAHVDDGGARVNRDTAQPGIGYRQFRPSESDWQHGSPFSVSGHSAIHR